MCDEAGHLLGEYNSTGGLVQETIWLGDIPVATIRPNGAAFDIFYVHTDHLNTPRKVSRPSDNKLRWTWDPDPFGTTAPNTNPASLGAFTYNLRFPGQLADSQAGFNQNYFRDYDPAVGRYVQSDPIGLGGGINTYGYVRHNPLSCIDRFGLKDCLLVCVKNCRVTHERETDENDKMMNDALTECRGSFKRSGMAVGDCAVAAALVNFSYQRVFVDKSRDKCIANCPK